MLAMLSLFRSARKVPFFWAAMRCARRADGVSRRGAGLGIAWDEEKLERMRQEK